MLVFAVVGALVCGAAGWMGGPLVEPMLSEAGLAAPRAYAVAQGAHLGSYLGATIGTVRAVVRIRRARLTAAPAAVEPS